jgi:putative tricarboxylic transport membrane protein
MQRRFEISAAVVLWGIAVLGLYLGRVLPFGTVVAPGPGFFPRSLLALLAVAAAGLLIAALRTASTAGPALVFRAAKPGLVLAVLLAYAAVLEPVGFVPATLAVVVILLRIVGGLGWPATVVSALLISLAISFLFDGLGVRLPSTPWWL